MPGKSLLSIRVSLIAAAVSVSFLLAATPAAWSQSPSAGGASQLAQTNSGSGDGGVTIGGVGDLLDSPDVTVTVGDAAAADLASCDKEAANPTDPKRPSGVAGVAFDKIDAKQAIEDCRDAVMNNPDEARAKFELGRALEAVQQYDEAMSYYRKAADAGYAAAAANIGHMYEMGTGITKDLSLAKNWYQKAVDAGDALAKGNLSDVEEAMATPATPKQVAPSPLAETASDDKPDILSRLAGTWINMTDAGCLIGFNANVINYDYSDCRRVGWDYVGIKKWESPSLVYLYTRDGGLMNAKVTFYGDRVSFRLWNCADMYNWCYVGSFGFEKLN
jgi:tetratricopeptide (TPR) repeat protein